MHKNAKKIILILVVVLLLATVYFVGIFSKNKYTATQFSDLAEIQKQYKNYSLFSSEKYQEIENSSQSNMDVIEE